MPECSRMVWRISSIINRVLPTPAAEEADFAACG
jgi:hypothetical protein